MDKPNLAAAIHATFKRRGTRLPEGLLFGLSDEFAKDAAKQSQWRAFLGKNQLQAPDLLVVVTEIRAVINFLNA